MWWKILIGIIYLLIILVLGRYIFIRRAYFIMEECLCDLERAKFETETEYSAEWLICSILWPICLIIYFVFYVVDKAYIKSYQKSRRKYNNRIRNRYRRRLPKQCQPITVDTELFFC